MTYFWKINDPSVIDCRSQSMVMIVLGELCLLLTHLISALKGAKTAAGRSAASLRLLNES